MQQILVVDDEVEHLNAICELLQGGPYQVLRTSRPERALTIAQDHLPDLVITDWDMPGLSGIELIQRLKAREATRDIPVIMCTGQMTSSENLEAALDAGAVDYVRKPVEPIELRARTRSMLQLSASFRRIKSNEQDLARQNELLNRQAAQLHVAAITDPLTGLCNRAYLMDQLSREFSNSQRHDRTLSCLLLDVDHFKSINDNHGHLAGDGVLREIAQRLRGQLRRGDVLGRYGGEEFLVLLPDTAAGPAAALAESLRASIAQTAVVEGDLQVQVSVSIGVADQQSNALASATQLLKHADEALYAAKRQGRNRVVAYAGPGG